MRSFKLANIMSFTILLNHRVTIPVDELGGVGFFDVVGDLVTQRKVGIQSPSVNSMLFIFACMDSGSFL